MPRRLRSSIARSSLKSELVDTTSDQDTLETDRVAEVLDHRQQLRSPSPTIKNEPDPENRSTTIAGRKRVSFAAFPILTDPLEYSESSVLEADTESHKAWLKKCRERQVELYGQLENAEDEMGIRELDLHHNSHECYNAFLFVTMRPSAEYEQESRSSVFGYGIVELKVVYDKASASWERFTLENVKYIQGAPQENNHRIGIRGLPYGARVHLPKSATIGDSSDGFVSISGDVGCAVGRINQGSRKIWALRTYGIRNAVQDMELAMTNESVSGEHADSGSKKDSGKRQREDDGVEQALKKMR